MDMSPFAAGAGGLPMPAAPTSQQQVPDYLKQQANPTMPGAAANIIRALMAGAQKGDAAKAANPTAMGPAGPGSGDSMTAPGAPLNITPNLAPAPGGPMGGPTNGVPPMASPPSPTPPPLQPMDNAIPASLGNQPPLLNGMAPSMPGGPMSGPGMGANPWMQGQSADMQDPAVKALFSQIPSVPDPMAGGVSGMFGA